MDFVVGYCSEVGTTKKVNQDSLCIKQAQTSAGKVIMAAVCDGMGGLSKGELASATVIRGFSDWFTHELPQIMERKCFEEIGTQWRELIQEQNQKLWSYGNDNGVQLGTTLTVLLLLEQGTYYIAQVGDTRAYEFGSEVIQLTEDQSFVAREVKRGNMTPEQARTDSRRNILLQCIGASREVLPEITSGKAALGKSYLLCSDGFRHEVKEAEMLEEISAGNLSDRTAITHLLTKLVHLCEERGEKDNISTILIHIE